MERISEELDIIRSLLRKEAISKTDPNQLAVSMIASTEGGLTGIFIRLQKQYELLLKSLRSSYSGRETAHIDSAFKEMTKAYDIFRKKLFELYTNIETLTYR